jgi:hypothetical protein
LVREIERLIRENGLARLELAASINAEAFYAAHGYEVRERSDVVLGNGHRMSAVWMGQESLSSSTLRLRTSAETHTLPDFPEKFGKDRWTWYARGSHRPAIPPGQLVRRWTLITPATDSIARTGLGETNSI